MKKMIALMMALAIIASFAACGNKNTETETTTVPVTEQVVEDATTETTEQITGGDATNEQLEIKDTTTALDILDCAWISMGAEHQPSAYGGHMSEEFMHGPYTYDLAYAEDLAATLLLPADQMGSVVDAATVVHMLNANSMTAGVVKLKEGTDMKAFADATAERISNNRWMCGFPEKLVIVQVGEDFLFVGYGLVEMMDPMVNGLKESITASELYNQPLE